MANYEMQEEKLPKLGVMSSSGNIKGVCFYIYEGGVFSRGSLANCVM